jgi:hypothetical protein
VRELQKINSVDAGDGARYEKLMADIRAGLAKAQHDYAKRISQPEQKVARSRFGYSRAAGAVTQWRF